MKDLDVLFLCEQHENKRQEARNKAGNIVRFTNPVKEARFYERKPLKIN